MNAHMQMQDAIGLTKVDAAVAARLHDRVGGDRRRVYACRRPGPRRGDQDRHRRICRRAMPRSCRPGGEMPVYYARPAGVANPPVILVAMEIFGLHEYIKDVTRRLGKIGAFADRARLLFPLGDLTKIDDMPKLFPIVNAKTDNELFADLDARRRLGEVAGRQYRPARHHGLLPRRPHRVALFDPQSEPQGRRRLLWQPRRSAVRGRRRSTPRRRSRSRCSASMAPRTRASRSTR